MPVTDILARTLFAWQRNLVFARRPLSLIKGISTQLDDVERWWLQTEEGPVEAWFLHARAEASRPGGAVIFSHGNAEVIDQWPDLLRCYLEWGVSVLLPEYRGYGRSAGKPSQATAVSDALAFWDRLAAQPGIDPDRIVLQGRSLGGGVACAVAAERPPAALILQSTFTSIWDVAKRWGAPRALILDHFDSLKLVSTLDRPMLIVHGTQDRLIPVKHAHALHAAAPRSKLLLYEADHNDCPPDWSDYTRQVKTFLQEADIL